MHNFGSKIVKCGTRTLFKNRASTCLIFTLCQVKQQQSSPSSFYLVAELLGQTLHGISRLILKFISRIQLSFEADSTATIRTSLLFPCFDSGLA